MNSGSYRFLFLMLACFVLGSCIFDEYPIDDESMPDFHNNYSINLTVTLDQLGGTRAGADPLKVWDDYIDPEKFRVLFFDHNDKFLFESKSRWVKQLAPTAAGYAQWMVSIPMFSYGNDVEYDWPWEEIRNALTKNSFKIAILANRPNKVWYPTFSEAANLGAGKDRWLDNTGPNWDRKNSIACTDPKDPNVKDVFDLHHCQYDLVYHAKGLEAGYYSIIMDDYNTALAFTDMEPTMGATCSWVLDDEIDEFGNVLVEKSIDITKSFDEDYPSNYKVRTSALPSEDHPIPMYGIQRFEPIKKWIKGTPFNLSKITTGADGEMQTGYEFKSIALLRSVVKLELLLPKGTYPTRPTFVSLWYSNIYSRCEPLNNWDPTEDVWKPHDAGCDWDIIMQYGPFVSSEYDNPQRNSDGIVSYFQETLSWYYGAWKQKNWPFRNRSGEIVTIPHTDLGHPQVFNPCVQRNKVVVCGHDGDISDAYNDGYWHFVMYTGERNMTDPNNVDKMNSKNAYATCWIFKDRDNDKYYAIPIADYSGDKNKTARGVFGPYKSSDFNNSSNNPALASVMPRDAEMYGNSLKEVTDVNDMPWPLIRNHVYRITVGGNPGTRSGESEGLVVSTEDFHSESLKAF